MELVLYIAVSCLFTIYDIWAIQRQEGQKLTAQNAVSLLKPKSWKQMVYCILVPTSCVAVALMLHQFYCADIIFTLKHLVVIGLLWPIAATDYREYRIPNKLILLGLFLRVMILLPEGILYGRDALGIWIAELIAAVAMVVICVVCMLLSQGSMGMGDLKLLAMMAMFLGIEGICYAMCFSMIVSFVAAVSLLIAKKKNRKDVIPFAPFVLIGALTSFILSGT